MDLPSTRELELETLLRQRESQLRATNDELCRLRQYLANQAEPSPLENITLPPSVLAFILPHLSSTPIEQKAQSGSRTVTTALVQRARILQEENDELYDILKSDDTGKLREQVRTLTRVVERLELALSESHQAIQSLTTELDKTYETLATRTTTKPPTAPRSPATSHHALPIANASVSKLPPTGPRAHKKPRLSDTPQHQQRTLPPHSHGSSYRPRDKERERERSRSRSHSRSRNGYRNGKSKMDIDDDDSEYSRPRGRGKDRERTKEEKDRDRRRKSGGGGSRRTDKVAPPGHPSFAKGDRTLAERMGVGLP